MIAAAEHLLRGPVGNAALADEARPWVESFEVGAHAIATIARLHDEGRLDTDAAELAPFLATLRERGRRVFGDVLDMTLSDLLAEAHPTNHTTTTATITTKREGSST